MASLTDRDKLIPERLGAHMRYAKGTTRERRMARSRVSNGASAQPCGL